MKKKSEAFIKVLSLILAMVVVLTAVPFSVFADTYVSIDSNNFRDDNLRAYVLENLDTNKDSVLSESEILAVTELDISNLGIEQITGIQYFTELETLNCSDNPFYGTGTYGLDQLTKLKYLYMENTSASWINLPKQLEVLDIKGNKNLTYVNVTDFPNLVEIDCSDCGLKEFYANDNPSLKKIYCASNALTSLSVTGCPNLEILNCNNNNLMKLDVTKNTKLVELYCNSNSLMGIDLSKNTELEKVDLKYNVYDLGNIGSTYALSTLIYTYGFQIDNVVEWQGADISGQYAYNYMLSNLTQINGQNQIKYTYDLGNGETFVFTFVYNGGVADFDDDDYSEELVGYTITLNGRIEINFHMILGSSYENSETAYMHFTLEDGAEQDVAVKDAIIKVIDGVEYYVFPCLVPAKEMVDDVTAQIIDGDNKGNVYTYTVKDYSETILENRHTNLQFLKASSMLKGMLNYGSYSQLYFEYKHTELANDSKHITEAEKLIDHITGELLESYKSSGVQECDFAKLSAVSLVFRSETIIKLYFSIPSGVNPSDVTFYCEGEELQKYKSGSYYYVYISNISAQDLDKYYTITANYGDNSFDFTYCALTYCYNVLSKETTPTRTQELKNTVAALYIYHRRAKSYFNNATEADV